MNQKLWNLNIKSIEMERKPGIKKRHFRVVTGAQPRTGEPSFKLLDKTFGRTHATRERQLHDEDKSCGTQPAYIRVINRRIIGSAPLSALKT
jgi:hypothetical protein